MKKGIERQSERDCKTFSLSSCKNNCKSFLLWPFQLHHSSTTAVQRERESKRESWSHNDSSTSAVQRERESWSLRESHWSLSLGSTRLDSALSWKKVSVCAPVCVFGLLLSLVVVVVFTFASLRALLCLRRRLCAVCQCLRRVSYNLYSPLGVRFSRRAVVAVAVVSPTTRRVGCIAIFRVQFCILQCSSAAKRAKKYEKSLENFVKCIKNLLNYLFATRFTYSFVCPNRETEAHKTTVCVLSGRAAFGHIRCV